MCNCTTMQLCCRGAIYFHSHHNQLKLVSKPCVAYDQAPLAIMAAMGTPAGTPEASELVITAFGGFDKLQVQDTVRVAPKAGEVQVAIKAAGVNFAELMARVRLPNGDKWGMACCNFRSLLHRWVFTPP